MTSPFPRLHNHEEVKTTDRDLSVVPKVRAVRTVTMATNSLPSNTSTHRGGRSRRIMCLSLASPGRTPAGFPVNSRGWSEGRATPPDPAATILNPGGVLPPPGRPWFRGDGTTPPGWWALRLPFPGVRSCLTHPRLFMDNPSGVGLPDICTNLGNDLERV